MLNKYDRFSGINYTEECSHWMDFFYSIRVYQLSTIKNRPYLELNNLHNQCDSLQIRNIPND